MTTTGPLSGLRVIEISAFVAAPLAGMTLAQLGAEVIRIDPLGGNIDFERWPLSPSGTSIYWTGLNKAKRSVALDLKSDEGKQLATALIQDAGIVITNLPARGWLDYEQLKVGREDLIFVELRGDYDGTPAVDYTVNPSSGFPDLTGSRDAPRNHVLPAWDVSAGLYLGLAVLAAERSRQQTGEGQKVSLSLSDVMLSTVGNLGYIADVQINGHTRQPDGNYVFGAFGRDFQTSDGRRVMIAAMTTRQWRAIVEATESAEKLDALEKSNGADLATDGDRFAHREAIAEVLEPWFAERTLEQAEEQLSAARVLYGVYRSFEQLVREDPRCTDANPMLQTIDQPGVGEILAPRSPLSFASGNLDARPAPSLGQHTDEILATLNQITKPE